MKNVLALFVFEMFSFLSWDFGYMEKRLDKKTKVNFKMYDVTEWIANIYNTHCPVSQEAKAIRQWNLAS